MIHDVCKEEYSYIFKITVYMVYTCTKWGPIGIAQFCACKSDLTSVFGTTHCVGRIMHWNMNCLFTTRKVCHMLVKHFNMFITMATSMKSGWCFRKHGRIWSQRIRRTCKVTILRHCQTLCQMKWCKVWVYSSLVMCCLLGVLQYMWPPTGCHVLLKNNKSCMIACWYD